MIINVRSIDRTNSIQQSCLQTNSTHSTNIMCPVPEQCKALGRKKWVKRQPLSGSLQFLEGNRELKMFNPLFLSEGEPKVHGSRKGSAVRLTEESGSVRRVLRAASRGMSIPPSGFQLTTFHYSAKWFHLPNRRWEMEPARWFFLLLWGSLPLA